MIFFYWFYIYISYYRRLMKSNSFWSGQGSHVGPTLLWVDPQEVPAAAAVGLRQRSHTSIQLARPWLGRSSVQWSLAMLSSAASPPSICRVTIVPKTSLWPTPSTNLSSPCCWGTLLQRALPTMWEGFCWDIRTLTWAMRDSISKTLMFC